jgi:hypothetical protein
MHPLQLAAVAPVIRTGATRTAPRAAYVRLQNHAQHLFPKLRIRALDTLCGYAGLHRPSWHRGASPKESRNYLPEQFLKFSPPYRQFMGIH